MFFPDKCHRSLIWVSFLALQAGSSHNTVDSQIFARVLFSRNFAYAKFREMKSSRNGEIIMLLTYIGKSCHSRDFLRRKYVF